MRTITTTEIRIRFKSAFDSLPGWPNMEALKTIACDRAIWALDDLNIPTDSPVGLNLFMLYEFILRQLPPPDANRIRQIANEELFSRLSEKIATTDYFSMKAFKAWNDAGGSDDAFDSIIEDLVMDAAGCGIDRSDNDWRRDLIELKKRNS